MAQNALTTTYFEVKHKDKAVPVRKVRVWTKEEDKLLLELYQQMPKQWAQIASSIPYRNQNQCLHRYRRLSHNDENHKKIWSEAEDNKIRQLVHKFGKNWKLMAEIIQTKTGKQIRERYINKLDPNIKHGEWQPEEDLRLIQMFKTVGTRWSEIAKHMPGRPENSIKNRFYSYIKKHYDIREAEEAQQDPALKTTTNSELPKSKQSIEQGSTSQNQIDKQNQPPHPVKKELFKKDNTSQVPSLESIQYTGYNEINGLLQPREEVMDLNTYNHFPDNDFFLYTYEDAK